MKTIKKVQSGGKLPKALLKTGKPDARNSGLINDTISTNKKPSRPISEVFKSFNDSTVKRRTRYENGGSVSKAKSGKSFPDLNKDGKITKADILKGRGVIAKKGASVKKMQYGGKAASMVPMKSGGKMKTCKGGC